MSLNITLMKQNVMLYDTNKIECPVIGNLQGGLEDFGKKSLFPKFVKISFALIVLKIKFCANCTENKMSQRVKFTYFLSQVAHFGIL